MENRERKAKWLPVLLALCMVLSLVPVTVLAEGINYIDSIHVTYTHIDYKAGETPRTTAAVTQGPCSVAYEYWREIYQKEEGGVWSGTGRYWYSDAGKMASLAADKRITQFEAGHHYSYNIVLVTDRGYFINEDTTVVSVGEYEWGVPDKTTNLEVKEMSTELHIYSPYSIEVSSDGTDQIITGVSLVNVNQKLDPSKPISFTAKAADWCADKFDITEEAWEAGGSLNDMVKSSDKTVRAPVAGAEYWYSIVLKAKDGYVFSKDFSDNNYCIKEGSEVTFMVDGTLYENRFYVSENGKTLTAWEFMDPVTATVSAAMPEYKITEGANGAWTENTDIPLTIRANGEYAKFIEVKVDNKTLSADKYTAVSGSTVITLQTDYLATLSVGKHTLTVVYTDGECHTSFSVVSPQTDDGDAVGQTPPTGDSGKALGWGAVFLAVGSVLACLILVKKKKVPAK